MQDQGQQQSVQAVVGTLGFCTHEGKRTICLALPEDGGDKIKYLVIHVPDGVEIDPATPFNVVHDDERFKGALCTTQTVQANIAQFGGNLDNAIGGLASMIGATSMPDSTSIRITVMSGSQRIPDGVLDEILSDEDLPSEVRDILSSILGGRGKQRRQ